MNEDNEMQAQQAIAHATIQIKRANTGKVEEYNLVFTPLKEEEPKKEPE